MERKARLCGYLVISRTSEEDTVYENAFWMEEGRSPDATEATEGEDYIRAPWLDEPSPTEAQPEQVIVAESPHVQSIEHTGEVPAESETTVRDLREMLKVSSARVDLLERIFHTLYNTNPDKLSAIAIRKYAIRCWELAGQVVRNEKIELAAERKPPTQ